MLLFETKLSFGSSCRSMWPRCNTVYCQWGRYDTTDIINLNAIAADRVNQGSHTLKTETEGNGLFGENQGNLMEFTKILREFLKTAKSQGIPREWLWQIEVLLLRMLHSFSFVLLSVSWQNYWKNKPFTNSPRVYICYIYLPMVNWWMVSIHPNNGVHFHFMKIFMLWT